jgi:hypothetical protein
MKEPQKRGRPPTGVTPMMGFRADPSLRATIEKWAKQQLDKPKLSEATRRLVELGLTVQSKGRQSSEGQKRRARELAGNAIDGMTEFAAHADDRASRKRHLLGGPEEFRDVRIDRKRK